MSERQAIVAMDPEEERALVEGLCMRDPSAVDEFVSRTHRNVFAMACRLTIEESDREDWTHDVLLRILDEMANGRFVYRWPGGFWSWFGLRARFLMWNCRDRQRRLRGPELDAEANERALDALEISHSADPQRILERLEAQRVVEDCIAKLASADHRRALSLLLLEGLSYQDIADEAATPLNTVRSWIRRGRVAVRECVSAAYGWKPAEEDV